MMRLKWGCILLLGLILASCVCCTKEHAEKTCRSGIYLCGEFNHWQPDSTWEFLPCGDGVYALYDKEVYIDMIIDMRRAKEYDYPLWSGNASGKPIVPGEPYRLTHSELHYIPSTYAVTRCDSIILHIVDRDSATLTLHSSQESQWPQLRNMGAVDSSQVCLSPVSGDLRVLGLGNSLLGFNRQDTLFNRLAQSLGLDALFFSHWHNGYSLQRIWDEGPLCDVQGNMSARALIAAYPWTHVVLQEQSLEGVYHSSAFADAIERWVKFIRQWCPNPDVQVVIVENWPLAMLWDDYDWMCEVMSASTCSNAKRNGAAVCPVGDAYQVIYEQSGREGVESLYADDRHPTLQASYLSACMKLSLITGISPMELDWHPAAIGHAEACWLREAATRVMPQCDNNLHIKTLKNSRRFVPLSGVDVDWTTIVNRHEADISSVRSNVVECRIGRSRLADGT